MKDLTATGQPLINQQPSTVSEGAELPIEAHIKRVIAKALSLHIDPSEIGDSEQLFDGGLGLNSLAAIEIIVGLEEEFCIQVPDEDLRIELFDSVRSMADYVRSRLAPDALPNIQEYK